MLWWLAVTCGIRTHVTGREHLPDEPCILLVKHQSTWDTLFVQTLLHPQTTLIKRELLWIPFFGWAFLLLKPIAINRHARIDAFRQLMKVGADRLKAGFSMTLFRKAPACLGASRAGFSRAAQRWHPPPALPCWSWRTTAGVTGPRTNSSRTRDN